MLRGVPLHKNVIMVLGAMLAMTLAATTAHAAAMCPVTVAWDANPEAFVTGYFVYVRTNGGHEERFNVGGATSYSYPAAVGGRRYEISVAAYTSQGVVGPRAAEVSTIVDGTSCDGEEPPDPWQGETHVAAGYRSRANLDSPVESLSSLDDGRVLAVEGGRVVRVVDANGIVDAPSLIAESTERLTEVVPDARGRATSVLVGVVDTADDGSREFSIVRYRDVGNTLGEGAAVVAGLAFSSEDAPRFTVDPNGWIYIAMPAARDGRSDPYAGRILRFDEHGNVPADADPRSAIVADGFATPSGLFSDGRRLFATGTDGRWPGSLATLRLDGGDPREWPRTLSPYAISSDGSEGERSIVALAGRPGADGQVVLGIVDRAGKLSVLHISADGTRSVVTRAFDSSRGPVAVALSADDRVIVAVKSDGTRISIVEVSAKAPRE